MTILSEDTLKSLHRQISSVFAPEYYNRYINVRLDNHVDRWEWRQKDFARLMSLLEFEDQTWLMTPESLLTFNGENDPEVKLTKGTRTDWCNLNYNDGCDLHQLTLLDKFEFVMLNQTLEHLYNPLRCLKNIYTLCTKEGGILYMNFPVNNLPHDEPYQFSTGITLMGAASLITMAGFKLITCGQWGNREYLRVMMEKRTWPTYDDLTQHALNERCCPVIGWVWGRK